MCGIVGYVGNKSPKDVLLEGLKKLEYRGYDSAGVAILNGDRFDVYRAEGKLSALSEKLAPVRFSGRIGIGHTRWATHGMPTEFNAHPHKVKGISLVQNGIIENYAELKEELLEKGVKFSSETDTEVVAHLIALQMDDSHDLVAAIQSVIPKLRGAYAMLVVSESEPETIVAFKAGPPLILGVGEGEILLASDVQAFIDHTNKAVYLDDFEIVKVKGAHYEVFSLDGITLKKPVVALDLASEKSDKKGFKHYMLKEIYEQPRAVANALTPYVDIENKRLSFDSLGMQGAPTPKEHLQALANCKRIYIVACGTSFYAGLYGKYLIEPIAGVAVDVDIASEFRYRDPVLEKNAVAIFVSQSGETADTLAALRLAKEKGLTCLSICNTKASTIDREADLHLYMNSGLEVGVASTKAFISTLSLFNLLALYLAQSKDLLTEEEETRLVDGLLALPSLMEACLAYDTYFKEAAQELTNYKGFLYLGRGHSYPIALEGALKLKELAYRHAEGYAAGEMKHGPLALIDQGMLIIVICPRDKFYEKTVSNLEEAKARGGVVFSIGSGDDKQLKSISKHYLGIPEAPWMTSGILSVIPVQLLAYHLADALGHDVDQPRNLAKSVTVE
ncbi:MAG: glutamine--fructose-6-phosphate transaminase (isomerizing) [Bdellovibrionales bacterium]|nr:glutamine--fructose-6-phosphate transaminase (isomerizing) [Bdellovibrionales bacterium]